MLALTQHQSHTKVIDSLKILVISLPQNSLEVYDRHSFTISRESQLNAGINS